MTAPTPILDGLRVVEISAFVAAPSCGLALAQLGAEVIRVDPPGGNIDIGRLPLAPSGRSIYWASLNRGKRSVEIDFRKPEGQRLVRALLNGSGPNGGILVTNLSLSGGLAYEPITRERPDAIVVQLSGSPDGRNALDYTVNCAVGFPLVTGDGRAPVNHVLPAWDAIAGVTLATAVLAAERRRRETGQGQLVKLTLADVAMAMTMNLGYTGEIEVNGTERKADGNFLYGAYGDVFKTADGRYVMTVAISDRQWQALARATGLEGAIDAAAQALGLSLADEAGRYDARELISAFLRPWFAKRTLAEIEAALADRTILWGVYRTAAQMLAEDARFSAANPMFKRVEHDGVGSFLTAASPLDFSNAPRVAPAAGPRLGHDTAALLAERAGIAAAELDRLAAAGIVGRPK
jgi:2-methylfumaryl-CoA isomerase